MKAAGKDTAPAYWYMVASPAEEEYYIKGVTEVIGRVPFFGGSAADNTIAGDWMIYNGAEAFADGCVVAFFYTDTPFANKFTGAYAETGDFGVVTKMSGDRQIVEIDGKPALQVYADWRGMSTDELMGGDLLAKSVVSPLGFKDRLGDLTAIRHPMNGNDDLSINVGNKVTEKTCVIRMEGDVDCLVGSVSKTAEELKERIGTSPRRTSSCTAAGAAPPSTTVSTKSPTRLSRKPTESRSSPSSRLASTALKTTASTPQAA